MHASEIATYLKRYLKQWLESICLAVEGLFKCKAHTYNQRK